MNKRINIIAFGQIAEITGRELKMDAEDLKALNHLLTETFPLLKEKKYAIAINKRLTSGNVALRDNDVVALMPPYSGG